jgi:hypothetical protein
MILPIPNSKKCTRSFMKHNTSNDAKNHLRLTYSQDVSLHEACIQYIFYYLPMDDASSRWLVRGVSRWWPKVVDLCKDHHQHQIRKQSPAAGHKRMKCTRNTAYCHDPAPYELLHTGTTTYNMRVTCWAS